MTGIANTIIPCDGQGSTERSEVEAWPSLSIAAASSPSPGSPHPLVQLRRRWLDPGRDTSGSSNLFNPWMYPSTDAQGHRTGYMGDFTERSPSGPLEAFKDTSSTSAKSVSRRWPDGSMTATLK